MKKIKLFSVRKIKGIEGEDAELYINFYLILNKNYIFTFLIDAPNLSCSDRHPVKLWKHFLIMLEEETVKYMRRYEKSRKRGRIMGTNYYAVKKQPTVFGDGCIHIGKSSAGWRFLFHDCEWFHTFPQVKKFLEDNADDYVILDEYDKQHSIDDFLDVVAEHQKTKNKEDFTYGVKNIDGYRFCEGEFC